MRGKRPRQPDDHPFIWVKGGIAHAIPRSEALATDVAAANRGLVVGRLYLSYGEEIAMVVFDEAIFGGQSFSADDCYLMSF